MRFWRRTHANAMRFLIDAGIKVIPASVGRAGPHGRARRQTAVVAEGGELADTWGGTHYDDPFVPRSLHAINIPVT